MANKRLIVGITGATGSAYGIRLLEELRALKGWETHLVLTDAGVLNAHQELGLKRKEIDYLFGKVKERGLSVIPLKLYFKGARVKLEVGLGRGKKLYDKRHDIAERDARRDIERATRIRGKRSSDRG